MDNKETLVLSNEPLSESDTMITLNIFNQAQGAKRSMLLKEKGLEGKITFDPERCLVFFIPPGTHIHSELSVSPDRTRWDLYLIIIPFTLHEPPDESYYEKLIFLVDLMDTRATAFDLFPRRVLGRTGEKKTYELTPTIKMNEIENNFDRASKSIRFSVLHPTIIAFGEGHNVFYWVYKGLQEQEGVIPETKHALVVLQVPRGTPAIAGAIECEVRRAEKRYDTWVSEEGRTDPHPIYWELSTAPSLFETESKQVIQATASPTSAYIDVCIICALAEEAEACKQVIAQQCGVQFDKIFNRQLDREYYHTRIQNVQGEALNVLVSWLPANGPVETSLHLKPLLEAFQPRFVAMTGICAGNQKRVKLGDLVVAHRAYFYDTGKFILDSQERPVQLHDVDMWYASSKVRHFIRVFDQWQQLTALLPRPIVGLQQGCETSQKPDCHIATIATGSAVRGDNLFNETRFPARDTIAIDMEGAAFYRTVGEFPGIHSLVVKGVSDYANGDKDDSYHHYASSVSATYILSFIREHVNSQEMPQRRETGFW